MKTFAIRLAWSVVGVITICLLGIVIILNSSLLTPCSQWLIRKVYLPDFQANEVTYIHPYQFHFSQIHIDKNTPTIAGVDMWINPYRSSWNHLHLDSILLDQMSLSIEHKITLPKLAHVSLSQLAIKHVNVIGPDWVAKNATIQIEDPEWTEATPSLPYGKVQSYIDEFTWKKEHFTHLLLNAEIYPQHSVIYGLSAKWLNGDISLQAKKEHYGWTVLSVNASHVHLHDETYARFAKTLESTTTTAVVMIKRIDVLNSQYEGKQLKISNLNMSLDNIAVGRGMFWEQRDSVLSASADSISVNHTQWIDANLQLEMHPQTIKLIDFNGKIFEGNASVSATITPEKTTIDWLKLQHVKYFIESDNDNIHWQNLLSHFNNLTIAHASIQGSQIIQLANKPFWQLSGANMRLDNATLINHNRFGFWSGHMNLSANNLSYDGILGFHGSLQMNSDGQTVSLDSLTIPLKDGMIRAKGQWAFNHPQRPWSLSAEARSFPPAFIQRWLTPIAIDGAVNLTLSATGNMAGNTLIADSINGDMAIQIEQGTLLLPAEDLILVEPFSVEHLTIRARQGHISIPTTTLLGNQLDAKIQGEFSLTAPMKGEANIAITERCQQVTYNFLSKQSSTTDTCAQSAQN